MHRGPQGVVGRGWGERLSPLPSDPGNTALSQQIASAEGAVRHPPPSAGSGRLPVSSQQCGRLWCGLSGLEEG